jgi:hypothetical protein
VCSLFRVEQDQVVPKGRAVLALQAAAVDPMAAERSGAARTYPDAGVFQYADSLQRPPLHPLLDRLLAGAHGSEYRRGLAADDQA